MPLYKTWGVKRERRKAHLAEEGGGYVHRFISILYLVKSIAKWKTLIGSMQSLGMDNFRVAYTISRFQF